MNYLGLFEGISGFGLAFKRAGAKIIAVCEIEPNCQKVLKRHHPDAELISDVKTITKDSFKERAVDVIAGGFPCQDLSVAGLRKGLDGERSGLWFEFLRVITDHQPRWVVIENVPGLLSSNGGRDFAVILRGLVECGYGVAWRILDSQFDGVAQRRQRVFIVASLGNGRCAEILFEREGGAWDSPPRREEGERVADSLTVGANQTCGFPGDVTEHQITGTLNARTRGGGGFGTDFERLGGLQHVAGTIAASGAGTQRPAGQCNELDFLIPSIAFTERTRRTGRSLEASPELAYALTDSSKGGNPHSGKIAGEFGVRRLTPTECERLQGFPDGHTATGFDGKPLSDSARYRMLGNAVCVPTAQWIADRIMRIEQEAA